MQNLLSLTKVGNLKIGRIRNGKPIATERILVTMPTKENQENFKILHGFSEQGETSVNVSLPFDSIDLNFEVNYVGFATINEVEYILKSPEIGEKILAYPLNPEDFDKKIIDMGELNDKSIERFTMKKTGFLKVHLDGFSSFGEVFYYKTSSVNTIRAITDQLRILSALTNGKIAGIPLKLKPVKKDVNEKQIVFLSIGFEGSLNGENFGLFCSSESLNALIEKRKNSSVDFQAFEKLYEESRIPNEDDIISFEELKNAKVEIDIDSDTEIKELEKESEEKEISEDEKYVRDLFKEKGISKIPAPTGLALFNAMNKNVEVFEEYFAEEKTLPEVVKKISELK